MTKSLTRTVRSFLGRYWKALGATLAGLALLLKAGPLVEGIRTKIAYGVHPIGPGRYALSEPWGWALTLLLLLLLASLLTSGKLFSEIGTLKREQEARRALTERALQGMMHAATRIVNQLYPLAERPPFVFEQVQRTYYVTAEGDTSVKATYRIRAHERPLHFWALQIAAESDAPAVHFLDEIDFQIRDEAGSERVAYLMTKNQSHYKEISVFFLPQISPGEPARNITFTYTWPRMVARLLEKGEEDFTLRIKSRTRLSEIEYAVYFHPKLCKSYDIRCELIGTRVAGETLEAAESQESGWKGWRYRALEAPAEGFLYELRFTAKARGDS